jgi:hypothetical protein
MMSALKNDLEKNHSSTQANDLALQRCIMLQNRDEFEEDAF